MSDLPHWDQNLERQIPGLREAVSNLASVASNSGFRVATIVLTDGQQPPGTTAPPTRIAFVPDTDVPSTLATTTTEAVERWAPAHPQTQPWHPTQPLPPPPPTQLPREPVIEQQPVPLRTKRASTSVLEGESGTIPQFGKRKRFSDPPAAALPGPSGAFWGTVLEERPGTPQGMMPAQRGPLQPPLVGPSQVPAPLQQLHSRREAETQPEQRDTERLQRSSTFPALRLRSPTGQTLPQPVLPTLQEPLFGTPGAEVYRDRYTSPPFAAQPGRQPRSLRRTASQLLGRLSPFGPAPAPGTTRGPMSPPPINIEGQLYRPRAPGLPALLGAPQRPAPELFSQPATGDTLHSQLFPPVQRSPPYGLQLGPQYGTQQSGSRSASGSGVSHAQPSRTTTSPPAEGVRMQTGSSSRGKRGRRVGGALEREQFFECDQCNSKFRRKSDKNRHVRVVHEKSRPFVCPICEKTFGEKSNMLKHRASVHDDVRTFRCPYCDASFSQRGLCDSHVRTVHDKKQAKYFCEHCGLPFSRKVQLTDHYEQVHPEFMSTYGRYYVGASSTTPAMAGASGVAREPGREDRSLVGDTLQPVTRQEAPIGTIPPFVGSGPAEGTTTPVLPALPFPQPQLPPRSQYEQTEEGSGRQRSFQGDSSS